MSLPAQAAVRHVGPGQSIQAAIDAAQPGDTIVVAPGVYHENLTITKPLTLLGSGRAQTHLEPGATPTPSICTSEGQVNGICVVGHFTDSGAPGEPVKGVHIDGFTVSHFSGFGVFAFDAADYSVTNVEARFNGSYGISGFVLSGVTYINDVAHDNGDPGFYIGDSPHANARVLNNVSYRNGVGGDEGFGFLFRDSSFGNVEGNLAWGNCVGFVFVDSGEDPAPMTNWRGVGNTALRNNGACPGAAQGPPPTSGIGFALVGTQHVVLERNTAIDNMPTGPSAFPPAGITVISSAAIGGSIENNNVVSNNVARDNKPVDIFWDEQGSGNAFNGNHCGTSVPSWICSGS